MRREKVPLQQYDEAQVKAVRLVAERLGEDCPDDLAELLSRAKTLRQARAFFNDYLADRVNELPPEPEIDTESRL